MTEILTESFCERCGTRYTFESAAPRKSRLARVRVLSKGFRNFVMSDDASLSEAMADARSEEEIAATSSQLDAFHQTFNFCLTCRQYTCSDCWNGPEGRCLTCAPIPGQEEPAGLVDFSPAIATGAAPANGHQHSPVEDVGSWPEADIASDRLARVFDEATEPEHAPADHEDADAVAPADAEPAPDTAPAISGLAPGQSLNDAIAAYEHLLAAEEAEGNAQPATPVAATEPDDAAAEPAPTVAAEPEPVVAAEPEPVVAAEPEPVVAAEPEPVAAEPAPAGLDRDDIPQPTWPVPPQPAPAAPAAPPAPAPTPTTTPWLTVAPEDSAPPEWPATPQWPSARLPPAQTRHDTPITLAGRPLLQSDATALWVASAQEVLSAAPLGAAPPPSAAPAPTAQPCVNCGLSLSANARFCRRCGSRQG